ncbi:unnamed protein product [Rotaria socialis]|uniref:Uncharacterized protein n=1 Tax=Rotaria socialis TaxID=392032 RepID=A0A821JH19_9BILA|nr:unnamed protein product [Rotaria socialis]
MCSNKKEYRSWLYEMFCLGWHAKVARPICTNKNKQECTEEFPDGIYIGCGNTPKAKSGLCEPCRESILLKDSETSLLTDDDKGIYDDPLMGCNVSRGDRYVGSISILA